MTLIKLKTECFFFRLLFVIFILFLHTFFSSSTRATSLLLVDLCMIFFLHLLQFKCCFYLIYVSNLFFVCFFRTFFVRNEISSMIYTSKYFVISRLLFEFPLVRGFSASTKKEKRKQSNQAKKFWFKLSQRKLSTHTHTH